MKRLTIIMNDEDHKKFKLEAIKRGSDMSEIVRKYIESLIKDK